ncbi:hypothetical protein ACFFYR_31955 [Paraburkholderia dipogonis]|uniref:hypothetical protein n=1 Tax=Paraburkholderia dipogonis TaxID=1211383 RepID=UPI00141B5FB8|nr:hypothetical protein [Paraburkholderia dipogonis]
MRGSIVCQLGQRRRTGRDLQHGARYLGVIVASGSSKRLNGFLQQFVGQIIQTPAHGQLHRGAQDSTGVSWQTT